MAFLYDFSLPGRLRRALQPLCRVVLTDEVETLGLTDAVIDHVELMMRALPPHLRVGLVAGLATFAEGARAYPGARGRSYASLPPELQEAYFASWWHSPLFPLKQFAKGIKGLIALSFWELPAVRERMAYHPEQWIAEVAARRLRDYADDIKKHDALVTAPDPLIPATSLTKKVHHEAA